MIAVIVYGSLKKGRYNHGILESSEFVGDTTLTGTMYSLGAYPVLFKDGDDVYPAEIYNVPEHIYDGIVDMERGAGYDVVETPEGTVFYGGERLKERCKTKEKILSY